MLNIKKIIHTILLEEKVKRDRCLRIADRKYDKPSAYKSGAVVRCRKGDIWKDLKENKIPGGLAKDLDLKDIAKIHGVNIKDLFVSLNNGIKVELEHTNDKEIAKEIALDHLYEDPKYYEKLKKIEEDESLHKWFKRQGTPGKEGGWVDCNAPIRKDGKITGYKPCGRKEGENRSKYPACRPTPSKCKDPGKGKSWGKTESFKMLGEEFKNKEVMSSKHNICDIMTANSWVEIENLLNNMKYDEKFKKEILQIKNMYHKDVDNQSNDLDVTNTYLRMVQNLICK
jgi:hypothetical protein